MNKIVTYFVIIGLFCIVKESSARKNENKSTLKRSIVFNGNFEEGDKKPIFWNKPNRIVKGEVFDCTWMTDSKSGKYIAIAIQAPGGRSLQWSSDPFSLNTASLAGQVRIKTKFTEGGDSINAGCRVIIHFSKADGSYAGNRVLAVTKSTHDWKTFKFSIDIPKNAVSAYIVLGALGCKGQFSFDDLVVFENTKTTGVFAGLGNSSVKLNPNHPIIIPQPVIERYGNIVRKWDFSDAVIQYKNTDKRIVDALKTLLVESGVKNIVYSSAQKKSRLTIKITNRQSLSSKDVLPGELGKQGYFLRITTKDNHTNILLLADSNVGKFYGIQTLKAWILKGNYVDGFIFDKPAFERRGLISGSHSVRRLNWLVEHKWNFIFPLGAPHNSFWFRGLNKNEKKQHKQFIADCNDRFIDVIVQIHPGYYRKDSKGNVFGKPLNFIDTSLYDGMMEHFKDLYALGVREFCLAWDDMGRFGGQDKFLFENDKRAFKTIANAQRIYTERVYNDLMKLDKSIKFSVIPMTYWLDHSDYEKNTSKSSANCLRQSIL